MTAIGLCEMTFSEKLKELLKAADWTAQELAEKTGLSKPSIKAYMRGVREPSFSNAARIAKAFGKTLSYFEDADEVTEPPKGNDIVDTPLSLRLAPFSWGAFRPLLVSFLLGDLCQFAG